MIAIFQRVRDFFAYLSLVQKEGRKIAWPSKQDITRALLTIGIMVSIVSLLFFAIDLGIIKLVFLFMNY